MKRYIYMIIAVMLIVTLGACKKGTEEKPVGLPVLTSGTTFQKGFFGDSLQFSFDVKDTEVPLSTLKAQLFYSEDMVSETVIRTKSNGTYTGKIYIPYYANIPNGTATLKFVLQNTSLTITEESFQLPLERPDYPYLTLVTTDQEYRMERLGLYEYGVKADFPVEVNGYIKAPAFGSQGNELNFGWENNTVVEKNVTEIPFSNTFAGNYTIKFNTFNYEASPFIAYAMDQNLMKRIDDNTYQVDLTLTNGTEVTIDGFEDLNSWWIDRDYFTRDAGKISFAALTGKYRITANLKLKYFIVEALRNDQLATLQADGTGAVWIIGEGIGKPSLTTNTVGWDTGKALCMAPIGDKKYRVTVVAGTNISPDNINVKFFHQKNWGGEFNGTTVTTTSDVVFIGDGSNGRDGGNLGILTGKSLEVGSTYVFTLDLKMGNDKAVLAVQKL